MDISDRSPTGSKARLHCTINHGEYEYIDFTAKFALQFARYAKEQFKNSKPDKAPHWNEVTRKDGKIIQDVYILEYEGLSWTDKSRERHL